MSETRRNRRQRYFSTAQQLISLQAERTRLADGFLKDVDMTEDMVKMLDKGIYPDKEFQDKWSAFKKMTFEIEGLKRTGREFIKIRESNRATNGEYIEKLKERHDKAKKSEVVSEPVIDRGGLRYFTQFFKWIWWCVKSLFYGKKREIR